ncbi:MAG: YhgE/Pip domain-containing protein [Mycobacteriaceae bacterium]
MASEVNEQVSIQTNLAGPNPTKSTNRWFRKKSWFAFALTGAILIAAGSYFWIRANSTSDVPLIALVNTDNGATAEGKPINAGDQVVRALQQSTDFRWEVVSQEEADSTAYFASVTISPSFSTSIESLTSSTPKQAELFITYNGRGSTEDEATINRLISTISQETGTAGIKDLLNGVSSARAKLQQVLLTAQLLAAGVNAADSQAQQALSGVKDLLPYLETARQGAHQLVSVADQVSTLVHAAEGPTAQLTDRLTELGITVGQVNDGTKNIQSILRTAGGFKELTQHLLCGGCRDGFVE